MSAPARSTSAEFDRRLWRPLGLFAAVAAGVVAGRALGPDAAWCFAGAGGLALLAVWKRGRAGVLVAALAVAVFAAGWWTFRVDRAPAGALLRAIEAHEARTVGGRPIVAVEGVVAETPETRDAARGPFAAYAPPGRFTTFRLAGARVIGGDGRRGSFWVTVAASRRRRAPAIGCACGDA